MFCKVNAAFCLWMFGWQRPEDQNIAFIHFRKHSLFTALNIIYYNIFSSHLRCHLSIQKGPRPSRQSANNTLNIITWFHSFVVNHEQMGQCDCHVNNVFQSIIWATAVITAPVVSHGRRLKVSYDLSWITDRASNLLRLWGHTSLHLKIFLQCLCLTGERRGRRYYLATADIYQPTLNNVPYASCFSLKLNFSFILSVDKFHQLRQDNSG